MTTSATYCADTTVHKCSVVAATTQNSNSSVRVLIPHIVHGPVSHGPGDLLHDIGCDGVKLGSRSDGRVRTACCNVDVEVRHSSAGEPRNVLLNPLGRADQPILLCIPRAQNDVALWLPALSKKLAECTAEFDDDCCTTVGIGCRNYSVSIWTFDRWISRIPYLRHQ